MKSTRAFTLLDFLIVIVIIVLVLALLFPATGGSGLNSAKKAEAANDVTQIANATLAYQSEYGVWPTNSRATVGPVSGAFLQALMGSNPKDITFLEVSPWKKGKGGVINNTYEDSWGNVYQIVVDVNYSKSLNVTYGLEAGAGSTNITLQKRVAVFNVTNSSDSSRATNYYLHSVLSW